MIKRDLWKVRNEKGVKRCKRRMSEKKEIAYLHLPSPWTANAISIDIHMRIHKTMECNAAPFCLGNTCIWKTKLKHGKIKTSESEMNQSRKNLSATTAIKDQRLFFIELTCKSLGRTYWIAGVQDIDVNQQRRLGQFMDSIEMWFLCAETWRLKKAFRFEKYLQTQWERLLFSQKSNKKLFYYPLNHFSLQPLHHNLNDREIKSCTATNCRFIIFAFQ